MPALPDPRCFATKTIEPLGRLAARTVRAADAMQRHALLSELKGELHDALANMRDDLLTHAIANVVSPDAGLVLLEMLELVINTPTDPKSGLAACTFAIPVVFVAGGLAAAEISGTILDTKAITGLLNRQNGHGGERTLRLGESLCAESALEIDSPSERYRALRSVESGNFDAWPDMTPAPIRLESAEESVHLRFLVGGAVAPAQAPSLLETTANIGTWGMPFSRELRAQLGQAGLSLLPLPRPPAALMKALHEGRRAREEVAFQVFTSRVLRRMRSVAAEPEAEVAALDSGAIGVRLASPFERERAETYRWQLGMLDDLGEVIASILGLLADCRVTPVRVLDRIVSDADFLGG